MLFKEQSPSAPPRARYNVGVSGVTTIMVKLAGVSACSDAASCQREVLILRRTTACESLYPRRVPRETKTGSKVHSSSSLCYALDSSAVDQSSILVRSLQTACRFKLRISCTDNAADTAVALYLASPRWGGHSCGTALQQQHLLVEQMVEQDKSQRSLPCSHNTAILFFRGIGLCSVPWYV